MSSQRLTSAACILALVLAAAQAVYGVDTPLPDDQQFAAIGPLPKVGAGYVNVLLAGVSASYAHGLAVYTADLKPIPPSNGIFLFASAPGGVATLGPFDAQQELVFGIDVYSANPMTSGGKLLYTLFSGPKQNNKATDNSVHTKVDQVDPADYAWKLGAGPYFRVCYEDRLLKEKDREEDPEASKDFNDFCVVFNGIFTK